MSSIVFQVLLFALILVLVIGFWAIFGLLEEISKKAEVANVQLKRIADEVIDDLFTEEVTRR